MAKFSAWILRGVGGRCPRAGVLGGRKALEEMWRAIRAWLEDSSGVLIFPDLSPRHRQRRILGGVLGFGFVSGQLRLSFAR